jgi:hypothetical protein
MPSRMLAVGLCAAGVLGLSACGSKSNPPAASSGAQTLAATLPKGRGVIDDPRHKSRACLLATKLGLALQGRDTEYVGQGPDQAKITFLPTPGSAQYAQIAGEQEGAEVIGNALFYPQGMSESHLSKVEKCLSQGVSG